MSDVVLVQPKLGDWDDVRSHPYIPLALLSTSVFLEKEYEVNIIDQRIDKNWEKSLTKELKKNPLCVGTTAMTGMPIKYALDTAKIVKRESDIPVVFGGVHTSLLPKQTLENEDIDIVIQGEGEITLHELVRALEKEKPLKEVDGIWYKENSKIKGNPQRPILDMNELPDIPYHLINLKDYLPKFRGRRTMAMQTSRGCPFRCAFCYNHVYNKRMWRSLSSQNTVNRIKKVVEELGISSIYLVDDNFFVSLKRAKEIAEGIIENGWDILWESQGIRINSAAKMDNEYLNVLEKSGCEKLHFGVESGSERIIKLIKKDIDISKVPTVNKKLSKFDIWPQYNFMAGFPTETAEDLKKSIDLMFKLMKDNDRAIISAVCIYAPYVGTEFFSFAVEHGLKEPSNLEGWINFTQDSAAGPWVDIERRKMLESVYLSSLFMDSKVRDMAGSPLVKFFGDLYQPIARYRLKHFFFRFMVEKKLHGLFKKFS